MSTGERKRVEIHVRGGVAHVEAVPEGVEVLVRDFDDDETGEQAWIVYREGHGMATVDQPTLEDEKAGPGQASEED